MTAVMPPCDTDIAAILLGQGPRQPIEACVCKFENLCSALLVLEEMDYVDFNEQQKKEFSKAMDEVEFKYWEYMLYSEEARAVCYKTRIDAALDEVEAAGCFWAVRELHEEHRQEMQKSKREKEKQMQDLEHVQ